MRKFILIILLFLFIYNVPFAFIPVATGKIVLFLSIIYLIFNTKSFVFRNIYADLKISSPFFLIIILCIYSFFANLVHGTRDYTMVYTYLIFFIEYFLGTFIIVYLLNKGRMKKKDVVSEFLDLFIIIATIQACLVYTMLFIPAFREFSFSILRIEGLEDLNERYSGFRGLGFASSVTYDFSVLQSLAVIAVPYQIARAKNTKNIYYYSIGYFFIIGSILMSGRTGLFGIGLSIFLFGWYTFKKQEGMALIRQNFSKSWLIYIFLSVLAIVYYIYILNVDTKKYIEDTIVPYAFEMFINWMNEGKLETSSTNVLQQMYFPIELNSFFWGEGYYVDPVRGGFYRNTDAGYMRQILFYGIFGSLILYFFYFKLLKRIYGLPIESALKWFFMIIIFYLFVVHYKGDILMGGSFVIKIVVLLYLIINLRNRIHKNEKDISSNSY